ncbi:unnamed protein product, partial [Menidia menidia]
MTVCLYECLKAVGLQHHYERFTLVGVFRAAHLSVLHMADYPLLGIHSMEERTRLFHLVQLVKTSDLKKLAYDDGNDHNVVRRSSDHSKSSEGDWNADWDDDGVTICGPVVPSFAGPQCVRRCLNFNDETTDDHQRLRTLPLGTGHFYESHTRNENPVKEKRSTTQVQLSGHSRNADTGVYGGRDSNSYEIDVHKTYSLYDFHVGQNNKIDIRGKNSTSTFYTALSPHCETFCPGTVTSKTFNKKSFGQKDTRRKFTKKICSTGIDKPTPVYEAKRTAGYNYGLPLSSSHAPNKRKVGFKRISVCVRKRPLTHAESRRGEKDVVMASGERCVIVHENKEAVDLNQYILQHKFYYDQVFAEQSSNEEVYQKTAYPLVQHMLSGGEATCFAYGQTGAGKTHTMLGSSPERPGLYGLAVRDIFAHLSTTHRHPPLLVYVSFFEIYCGHLYDLLDHRKRLFAREDGQKVVHISGLRHVRVDSIGLLLEVISKGTAERTQGMSCVNPVSSRSHALLQIQLRDPNQQIAGRMWFVDLAGSERASDAKNPNRHSRMEAAEINRSLLALKECIRSLDKEESHTPFRQSKLTQVLKDSFLGDSMTCMIANISPGHPATEHTLNTLRYADRVKELRAKGPPKGRRGGNNSASLSVRASNSSNNSSNVGTPEKPKLRMQIQAFEPSTPTTGLHRRRTFLCSTPKDSVSEEETQARGRGLTGCEHLTLPRGWAEISDSSCERKAEDERVAGKNISERHGKTQRPCVREKTTRAVTVLGQLTDALHIGGKKLGSHFAFAERETGFNHNEKENWQCSLEKRRGEKASWIQPRHETERNGGRNKAVKKPKGGDDKERRRHLRHYHQQLQQFIPVSASSSVLPHSSFTNPSISSSSQASIATIQHSCQHSLSTHLFHSLGDISDAHNNKVMTVDCNREQMYFPGGEKHMQTKTTKMETDERTATSTSTVVKSQLSVNSYSEGQIQMCAEGLDALNFQDNGMTSMPQREEVDCCSLDSSHRGNNSHNNFRSHHQRAPAERPLSPSSEYTNTLLTPKASHTSLELKYSGCNTKILPLSLKKPPETVSSENRRENMLRFSTNPLTALPVEPLNDQQEDSVYTQTQKPPDIHVKRSVLPQRETSSDPVDYNMDPLSISMLQVDQQPATASFLQGNNSDNSHFGVKISGGDDNQGETRKEHHSCEKTVKEFVGNDDEELCLSSFEMPQRGTSYSTASDTEQQMFIKGKFCRKGDNKPPLSGVKLTSNQDPESNQKKHGTPPLDNKNNPYPQNTHIHPSVHCQVSSPSLLHLKNSGSPTLFSIPQYANKKGIKPPSFITTKQSECSSGHLNETLSNYSSDSNISPMSKDSAVIDCQGRCNNQEIIPVGHLFSQCDLDHAKCFITEAYLEQLKEMEALCHKEGRLLCHQHDMAFEEYVHKLAEIMERKASCVQSMKAQLQPYLKPRHPMNTLQRQNNGHDSI